MSVDIKAKQRYRTILLGSLYLVLVGLCNPADDFLRSMGLFEYDPDVDREEVGEEDEYSDS